MHIIVGNLAKYNQLKKSIFLKPFERRDSPMHLFVMYVDSLVPLKANFEYRKPDILVWAMKIWASSTLPVLIDRKFLQKKGVKHYCCILMLEKNRRLFVHLVQILSPLFFLLHVSHS